MSESEVVADAVSTAPPPERTSAVPEKEAHLLKPLYLAGVWALLPIVILSLVLGSLGMFVLLDYHPEPGSWKDGYWANEYRKLIALNPFFSAFFVNGGMVGTMFCVLKLLEHRKAFKAAQGRKQPIKESKKTQ